LSGYTCFIPASSDTTTFFQSWPKSLEGTPRHGSQVNAKPLRGDLLGRSPSHQASTMGGEPKNTRHPSPSATNYNREDSFPRLSTWFVNLDSVPWERSHKRLTAANDGSRLGCCLRIAVQASDPHRKSRTEEVQCPRVIRAAMIAAATFGLRRSGTDTNGASGAAYRAASVRHGPPWPLPARAFSGSFRLLFCPSPFHAGHRILRGP